MGWQIVEQEEKEGKDNVRIVLCKQIKFFPSEKPNGDVSFIPLKFKVLKVIIKHDSGTEHAITWSNFKGTPRFSYKWGIVHEKDDSFGPTAFWGWMEKNRKDITPNVRSAFEGRMAELKIG